MNNKWLNSVTESLSGIQILDEAILREITTAADISPMELLEMFIEDAVVQVTAIQAAYDRGDRAAINHAAHTLKSTAGNVGAGRIVVIAKALEQATARESTTNIDGLPTLLAQAIKDFKELPHCNQKHFLR